MFYRTRYCQDLPFVIGECTAQSGMGEMEIILLEKFVIFPNLSIDLIIEYRYLQLVFLMAALFSS